MGQFGYVWSQSDNTRRNCRCKRLKLLHWYMSHVYADISFQLSTEYVNISLICEGQRNSKLVLRGIGSG
ncbi:hypothetical protein QVD17_09091 [Tagetes erecta]|uniref:Uncharacterized protein n=1 Tax=Tagetes erecta TaxID=13708 RepID=A0AAD8P3M1_TARER|nr:hypothetical protein QVD17_09091 [Tagetes erecta]